MTDADAPGRARLPDVALGPLAGVGEAGKDGGAVSLRERRHGTALVLVGATLTAAGADYLAALAAAAPALHGWDGRVLVVAGASAGDTGGITGDGIAPPLAALHLPFPVVADPEGIIARVARVSPPAVVVVDQWGEVRDAREVTDAQPWMPPAELEQWMRFLSIQCAG